MTVRKLIPPMSILLFLALTVAGTYYVRKHLLEQAVAKAMEVGDSETVRSVVQSWPSPLNAWFPIINHHRELRWTLLHWAIQKRDYELADWLIDKGARVEAICTWDDNGQIMHTDFTVLDPGEVGGMGTPLDYAVSAGRASLVRHLLARGAKVDGTGWSSPLSKAAAEGKTEIMTNLLNGGASVDRINFVNTATALHLARQPETVRLLLDHGANVNAVDCFGWTPLHYAAFWGETDVAAMLLSHGADWTIKGKEGKTALMLATEGPLKRRAEYSESGRAGRKEIADMLRKAGAKE